jgi:hypothetical protein
MEKAEQRRMKDLRSSDEFTIILRDSGKGRIANVTSPVFLHLRFDSGQEGGRFHQLVCGPGEFLLWIVMTRGNH